MRICQRLSSWLVYARHENAGVYARIFFEETMNRESEQGQ